MASVMRKRASRMPLRRALTVRRNIGNAVRGIRSFGPRLSRAARLQSFIRGYTRTPAGTGVSRLTRRRRART